MRYTIRRSNYDDWINPDGSVSFRTPDGEHRSFVNLEEIAFSDGSYRFDLEGESLSYIYRVYAAAFARTPDADGFTFWLDQVEDGSVDRGDLASEFADSDEFASRYGSNPTYREFIDALYRNVLLRPADNEGFDFWVSAFETGTMSRADMLESFAESEENLDRVADDIDVGIWLT